MTVAKEYDINEAIDYAVKTLLALFKVLNIPPLSKEIKTELFIYTTDDKSLRTAQKFQCEDITKPNSAFKMDQNLKLLFNSTKSKDGKELIGNAVQKDDINNNFIYLAYTDGQPEFTPLKEITISLIHFLRCLNDNGYDITRVRAVHNEFSGQVGVSLALLLGNIALSEF